MKTFLILMMVFFSCGLVSATGNDMLKEPESPADRIAPDTTEFFRFLSFTDESEWQSIPLSKTGSHFLGEEVARKFYLFKDLYTYKTPISPGNPAMRTVIRKPVVYNALNKMEKYLKKTTNKGDAQNSERLSNRLEHALDVAIAIYSQESSNLESALKESNNPGEIMNVFSRVELVYP